MTSTSLPVINTAVAAPGRAVEGIARVVRVSGDQIWLEPEQTTSCGHCSSSASCGVSEHEAQGIGTVASRLQARRFRLDKPEGADGFEVGDRLVIGVSERALLSASITAYGVPLACALVAGSVAQGMFGEDAATMLGMGLGLLFGLVVARINARRLAARGDLAPRYLRRARPDETCGA